MNGTEVSGAESDKTVANGTERTAASLGSPRREPGFIEPALALI
jgi:hypothetical protein